MSKSAFVLLDELLKGVPTHFIILPFRYACFYTQTLGIEAGQVIHIVIGGNNFQVDYFMAIDTKSFNISPDVNFTNILQTAFAPIFLGQKNYKAKLLVVEKSF